MLLAAAALFLAAGSPAKAATPADAGAPASAPAAKKVEPAEREAGFKAFAATRTALKGLSVEEADARMKKLVRDNPVFEAAGVNADGQIWARFRDGRLLAGGSLGQL